MIWAALRRLLAPISAWLPLIAIIVGGIAAGLGVWRVGQWRDGYLALRATQTALATRTAELDRCTADAAVVQQAARAAHAAAIQQREADQLIARRVEDALQTRLADLDRARRDDLRRLRDAEARRCAGTVSRPADAPAEPADAAGEPAGADGVAEATAALIAVCDADSARLAGWQAWWSAVAAGR